MSIECLCVKRNSSKLSSIGVVKAKAKLNPLAIKVRIESYPRLSLGKGIVALKAKVFGSGSVAVKEKVDHGPKSRLSNLPSITSNYSINMAAKSRVESMPALTAVNTDKLNGPFSFNEDICSDFSDYTMTPLSDVSNTGFISSSDTLVDLYGFIDEGVIGGNYHKHGKTGVILADENSYIETTGATEGTFFYKCQVSDPKTWLKDVRLTLRARIPFAGNPFKTPTYTIQNIKLTNSNAEIIVKFNDFIIQGDNLYTTYSTNPSINNCTYQWLDHPDLWSELDFYLEFEALATSNNDPFNTGFGFGFADAINNSPADGYPLQISAIELTSRTELETQCGIGPAKEDFIGMYVEIQEKGNRLKKTIKCSEFKTDVDSSLWEGVDLDIVGLSTNETVEEANTLKNYINDRYNFRYIRLNDSVNNKLVLEFGHHIGSAKFGLVNGAFSFGSIPGSFETAGTGSKSYFNSFFKVDELTLRISVKKPLGQSNFPIEVSGYTNDKLLAITPYNEQYRILSTNHLAIGGETVSSREAIGDITFTDVYEDGSIVDVTDDIRFVTYEVPLSIKTLEPSIGKIWDYSQSTFFESLILEISAITDGTEISFVELCATHAPSNAISLYSLSGNTIGSIESRRSEVQVSPSGRSVGDEIVNYGEPISIIQGIPHRYNTPATLKSNYSRRWRGNSGLVSGPFDPNMFDFSFENPVLSHPFNNGYFDFSDIRVGDIVHSEDLEGFTTVTGNISSSYSPYLVENSGLRFKVGDLFNTVLPGFTSNYKTIDFTSLENGAANLQNHILYGQIADSYRNCVRLDNSDDITFDGSDTGDGFSYFIRFSPDYGAVWANERLISQFVNSSDIEFSLGFVGGILTAKCKNISYTDVTVSDTVQYSDYSFPMSILVTYNDNNSGKLKLYTDNELYDGEWTTLRGESASFVKYNENVTPKIYIGKGADSADGMKMFVSDFGTSTFNNQGTNVVEDSADLLYRQVTAQEYLEGIRIKWWNSGNTYDSYKLWSYVNEDSNDWALGDFSVCMFNSDFSRLTERVGDNLLVFNLDHDGSSYASSVDSAIPTLIDSSLAYHTQIENDFLRFNLSEVGNSFYSTAPRIVKDLPYGYIFKEDAVVLDTILEHDSNDIVWPSGEKGPKLIISLYTRNKELYYESAIENLGLVTRKSYYLDPEQCWINLKSKFDLESLCDDSEAWSIFPREDVISEFSNKFYSNDINDMFIQYDLAYPSGTEIHSKIKIYTSHVRMEHSLIEDELDFSILSMYAVCDYIEHGVLNLFSPEPITPGFDQVDMFTDASLDELSDNLSIYAGGYIPVFETDSIELYLEATPIDELNQINMYTYAENRLEIILPMFVANDQSWEAPDNVLNMMTFGSNIGTIGESSVLNMACLTITLVDNGIQNESVNFVSRGSSLLESLYMGEILDLYVNPESIVKESLPLVLFGESNSQIEINSSISLFAGNYEDSDYLFWHGNNVGEDIEVDDEGFVTKEANDEIRGVDLFGYGNC